MPERASDTPMPIWPTDEDIDRTIELLIAKGLAKRIHTDRGEEIKITEEGREYLERAKRAADAT